MSHMTLHKYSLGQEMYASTEWDIGISAKSLSQSQLGHHRGLHDRYLALNLFSPFPTQDFQLLAFGGHYPLK